MKHENILKENDILTLYSNNHEFDINHNVKYIGKTENGLYEFESLLYDCKYYITKNKKLMYSNKCPKFKVYVNDTEFAKMLP